MSEEGRRIENVHSTVDFGKITIGNHLRWLVTDTNLETSWAPVNELNGALCLEMSDGGMDLLRNNVATIEKTCSHVFAVARITLHHLIVGFEASA